MPVNSSALDALRRLSATSYSPQFDSSQSDPTVQQYQLNQQFADETKDRIISNQRAQAAALGMSDPDEARRQSASYGGEVTALQNLLDSYNQDIAESPITQGIGEAEDYRQKERGAIMGGFQGGMYQGKQYANPIAAQAEAGRQMEQAKIDAPIREAEAKAAGDLAAQQAQSQGLRDVAKIQSDSLASQYAALQAALQGGNADAIKGFSMPKGGGSITFQSPTAAGRTGIPPTLLRDITTARTKLAQAGSTKNFLGLFPYGDTPEKTMYDQTIANALAAYEQMHPESHDIADVASFVSQNNDLLGLTADQLITHPKVQQHFDFQDMTPEEKNQLDQLLLIVRGMPSGQQTPDESSLPNWVSQ